MAAGFVTHQRLKFGDCDFSGTGYYPAYMNLLNGAVEEFFSHLGFPWHRVIPTEGWGTPTVHLSCDFARPSFMGDMLRFELSVLGVGRSSLRLGHLVSCEGETRFTATQVLAASHLASRSAMPWPDPVRTRLLSHLAPESSAASP